MCNIKIWAVSSRQPKFRNTIVTNRLAVSFVRNPTSVEMSSSRDDAAHQFYYRVSRATFLPKNERGPFPESVDRFDLELFKAGWLAVDRTGERYSFEYLLDDLADPSERLVVLVVASGNTEFYCEEGYFLSVDEPTGYDLVRMELPLTSNTKDSK